MKPTELKRAWMVILIRGAMMLCVVSFWVRLTDGWISVGLRGRAEGLLYL